MIPVELALITWLVVSALLMLDRNAPRGLSIALVGGMMLLPCKGAITLQGLPDLDRQNAAALGALVVGLVGLRLYLDSQWYVGVADGHVAVYRGIPAEVAGFRLHRVVTETEIPAARARELAGSSEVQVLHPPPEAGDMPGQPGLADHRLHSCLKTLP